MYKNTILKNAVSTALALPRYALWATTAVIATFSLTPSVMAVEGAFENNHDPAVFITTKASDSADNDGAVKYASELFTSTNPVIPSAEADFQEAIYTISGEIIKTFDLSFSLSGGATFEDPEMDVTSFLLPDACFTNSGAALGIVGAAKTKVTVGTATCPGPVPDDAQVILTYKLAGAAATLKVPGSKIEMTAKLLTNPGAIPVNPTRTIPVAVGTTSATVEITPEMGRLPYVFVSVADDTKLFVDKSPVTEMGDSPYVADDLVTIGYVKITTTKAADTTGKTSYQLGKKSGDKATLTITNGQFSASPGGVNASGLVYIDGLSRIEASSIEDSGATAKWDLTAGSLLSIANKSAETDVNGALVNPKGARIMIDADRSSVINDINAEQSAGPSAEMVITAEGQSSGITVGPTELRRIPWDGRVCWVYNVPPPAGNLDLLSVRISNETARAGTLVGTLYPEEGGDTPDFMSVNLLTKIAENAADPRYQLIEMVTDSSGVAEPGLKGGATIRLSAQDIADVGGVSWDSGRKVLKIISEISEIELLTLLRYGTASAEQAQSNVSTGATGKSCY